jgi:hypothetical protein
MLKKIWLTGTRYHGYSTTINIVWKQRSEVNLLKKGVAALNSFHQNNFLQVEFHKVTTVPFSLSKITHLVPK